MSTHIDATLDPTLERLTPLPANRRPIIVAVDDEPYTLEVWKDLLGERYDVRVYSDPLVAKAFFDRETVDVALLDVRMPGMNGMRLLAHLKSTQPFAEAILVTGHGTVEMAVEALQAGAHDFLCKPVEDLQTARRKIDDALRRKRLRQLNAGLSQRSEELAVAGHLIGESRALREVRALIDQIADSAAPVLVLGESGTGKELVARSLHERGRRASQPFVPVNCGAIAESLIDAELFGYEKGAFTGATASRKGLFEAADGGVLFLDEIGELPLVTQVRLLRTLQEGEVRPVGSSSSRSVDVRVVAATNVDVSRAMQEGKFREDLYYRVSVFCVRMPPLRERPEDIPLVAQHLLERFAARHRVPTPTLTDSALAALVQHEWRGNVRELGNALEHAATLSHGGKIDLANLPRSVTDGSGRRSRPTSQTTEAVTEGQAYARARDAVLVDFERDYLQQLLDSTRGNLSEASRRSGIDRTNLRRLLRRHGFDLDLYRERSRVEDPGP